MAGVCSTMTFSSAKYPYEFDESLLAFPPRKTVEPSLNILTRELLLESGTVIESFI